LKLVFRWVTLRVLRSSFFSLFNLDHDGIKLKQLKPGRMYLHGRYRQVLIGVVTALVASRYVSLLSTDLQSLVEHETTKETSLKLPDVVRRSLSVGKDPHNITAALCHKALFGDINLWMVLDWVAYHRLLGFDRIFMSYIPEVTKLDGFAELASLPYVTLFEYTEGTITVINDQGYKRLGTSSTKLNISDLPSECTTGEVPTAQLLLEARCLDQDAHSFNWVMLSDADEYLWFNENIGVKEFLQSRGQKYDYISFGKSMYTMKHRVNATTSGFNLENFPFTAGVFCTMQSKRGKPLKLCARKNGRAKIMLKPSAHNGHVCVHGTHIPRKRNESIQMSANVAHLKEWNSATSNPKSDPMMREKESFPIHTPEEANLHGFAMYPKNIDSSVTLQFDDKLHDWLDFVASRGVLLEDE
jgi:hypothetical protein